MMPIVLNTNCFIVVFTLEMVVLVVVRTGFPSSFCAKEIPTTPSSLAVSAAIPNSVRLPSTRMLLHLPSAFLHILFFLEMLLPKDCPDKIQITVQISDQILAFL